MMVSSSRLPSPIFLSLYRQHPTVLHDTQRTMDHHCHDHSHDHGDHDHDHDHDHPESTDPQGNLYSYIDHAHIAVLNVNDDNAPNKIIKPWHDRLNEEAVSLLHERSGD